MFIIIHDKIMRSNCNRGRRSHNNITKLQSAGWVSIGVWVVLGGHNNRKVNIYLNI